MSASSGDVATYVGIALAVLGAIGGVFKFLLTTLASRDSSGPLIAELRDRIDALEEDLDRERASREEDRRTYQAQIADLVGVSQVHVSRLLTKALTKLRSRIGTLGA